MAILFFLLFYYQISIFSNTMYLYSKNDLCYLTLIRAAGGVYDFRNFEEV